MPVLDAVFVGKIHLPEVSTGPLPPGAGSGPPPGIWPSPGYPAHPIAPGGPPPGFWGGVAPPEVSHPIAPGGAPPGFWGGVPPAYVDIGGPGAQPGPSHPIVLPPGSGKPPLGIWSEPILPPGVPPDGFWGGVAPPQIWGDPIVPAEPPKIINWHAGWSARTGWVIIGIPAVPAPTPSR